MSGISSQNMSVLHKVMRRLISLILLFPLCAWTSSSHRTPHPQIIGYFTEGGAKSGKYTVKDLITSGAAERLTEINYAFGRVADNQCQIADREAALNQTYAGTESVDGADDPAGDNQLRGTFHQLQEL